MISAMARGDWRVVSRSPYLAIMQEILRAWAMTQYYIAKIEDGLIGATFRLGMITGRPFQSRGDTAAAHFTYFDYRAI